MAGSAGLMDERVKTDIRLSKRLQRDVNEITHRLALSKNTFFSLATIRLLTELAPFATTGIKKRKQIFKNLRDHFQQLLDEAESAA